MYTVHCTGKAGGVQTESRPGFDRRQYDRADNKVMILMDNQMRLNCEKKIMCCCSAFVCSE